MPVKRKAPKVRFEFDLTTETHLTVGDCLIGGPDKGCGCGLVGTDGALRKDLARDLWRMHRREILDQWNRVQAVDWYRRTDPRHGFGAYGIPCFAEALLDGRVLPALDPAWPESVSNHWRYIEAALGDA